MREVLGAAAFLLVGSVVLFAVLAAFCALVALIAEMRCPRCSGRVAWLASGRPLTESRWRHNLFCFRCHAHTRVVRSGDGWIEFDPRD